MSAPMPCLAGGLPDRCTVWVMMVLWNLECLGGLTQRGWRIDLSFCKELAHKSLSTNIVSMMIAHNRIKVIKHSTEHSGHHVFQHCKLSASIIISSVPKQLVVAKQSLPLTIHQEVNSQESH
jgi:hypothetical protein